MPKSKRPSYRNSHIPRPRPEGVPRYRKVMLGDAGGYIMEQCLADCHTPENMIAYPYFSSTTAKGETIYYLNPTIDPDKIRDNTDNFRQYPDGSWGRWGGTKRRRRNHRNNSHKHRRRSGSKTRKR